MNFIFGFNVWDEFPYFKDLSDQEQATIETNIVRVINDSYVITGDQDYLVARFLAQKGLTRAFFWSASQTIEKYLKAFLLMNGQSIKDKKFNSHKLFPLLTEARKIDPTLDKISFELHPSINVDITVKKHLKNLSLHTFIEHIQSHGSPNNRYNQEGVDFNTAYLFGLDNFAFAVRSRIGVPDIFFSFNKIDKELIHTFRINNPFFNEGDDIFLRDIPSPEFPICLGVSVTHLDFLKKNRLNSIELRWLDSKMKL